MKLGKPIATGNTAEIYLHDNMVVKVFKDYLPETESEYEAAKQKFAYACGLPVPKVLDVTKIDGKQAIIMEYIKGRTLGDLLLETMEKAEHYIGLSIELQERIHNIKADGLEPMTTKLRRQIESARSLDQRHKSILLRKLNSFTVDNRLCHGDFHLFNLILTDKNVTIIDWVDASAGDIRADVCRSYLLYKQFSEELADLYIRMYCERSGVAREEILEWAPILAGARLSEIVESEVEERLLDIVNRFCAPY
ncbi:phosphotransferase family protein [Sporosarcina koreensis]|uniref:Phosphotransferase family protein n=1 Tax=Sporosarcina koreensis TaxID=334735 RepID=A0ABW0TVA2_9BACL